MEIAKQSLAILWAETGDIVSPTTGKQSEGWVVEAPARQHMNWWMNRTDTNAAYLMQHGIPEWDATTEYIINKSYVQYNGDAYKALATSTGVVPGTDITKWSPAIATPTFASEALKTVTPATDRLPYFTSGSSATVTPITAYARSLLDDVDAGTARTTLNAQQADATLTALAGVAATINTLPYFDGTDTATVTPLTAFGRSLIDDADAAAGRTTLDTRSTAQITADILASTNSRQPVAVALTAIANVTPTADAMLYYTNGTTAASAATTAYGRSLLNTADATAAKTLIGMPNVDNTSDANKPISTAQATAINGKLSLTGGTLTGTITGTHTVMAGTGNDYHTGAYEALGNGAADTVFPTVGFHQPTLYASSLQLRGGSDFRFYAQGAATYANVTANTFIGSLSGNASSATSAPNYLPLTGGTLTGQLRTAPSQSLWTQLNTSPNAVGVIAYNSDGVTVGGGAGTYGTTGTGVYGWVGAGETPWNTGLKVYANGTVTSSGAITAPTFIGALNGNANTAIYNTASDARGSNLQPDQLTYGTRTVFHAADQIGIPFAPVETYGNLTYSRVYGSAGTGGSNSGAGWTVCTRTFEFSNGRIYTSYGTTATTWSAWVFLISNASPSITGGSVTFGGAGGITIVSNSASLTVSRVSTGRYNINGSFGLTADQPAVATGSTTIACITVGAGFGGVEIGTRTTIAGAFVDDAYICVILGV